MFGKKLVLLKIILLMSLVSFAHAQTQTQTQTGEVSVMGSYSKSNLGTDSFSTTKRYAATAGYNLTPITEIELSFTYTDTFINYGTIQTTSINTQVLSLSVVQTLTPPDFPVQLYAKGGFAQYNRRQNGTIYGIPTGEVYTKSPSLVLGAGIRAFFLRSFSVKIEADSFLPDMKPAKFSENFSVQGGLGWHF